MHLQPIRAVAHKARRLGVVLAGISLLAGAHTALAQGTPPAPATNADQAPSEAARKAALSPYRFILLNANAPARKPAPAPVAAPAPAPAAEARRPAPAAEQAALASRPAPAPVAPPPAAAPEPVAPAPAPQPAVATLSTKPPEPAPVREVKRELIPVRTDEPRLSAALVREGASGIVRVQFDVNPDGSTSGVKVTHTTNRGLNRPSLDAIASWKFQPVDEVLTVETELVYKPQ